MVMRFTPLPRTHGFRPDYIRISGVITSVSASDETIWLDIPQRLSADVPDRLDGWLLWLLPHAFETQQELILEGPVDPELLKNAKKLMEVWSRWRPGHRPVRVHSEPDDERSTTKQTGRTGLFFTAGVDSFFSLFHHDEATRLFPGQGQRPVDDLIYVWGFDIPLGNTDANRVKQATLADIAQKTGKSLVTVMTNLRETGVQEHWGEVMHGPALGGVGLHLGNRWRTVLLSSGLAPGDTQRHGTSPLTDPLLSSLATHTVPYGADYDRFEKLSYIMNFAVVLDTLHVCWEERSQNNCSRCEKCYRTMLALDVLGVREKVTTFSRASLDLGRLAAVWKDKPQIALMYERLRSYAIAADRPDSVAAIDACLSRRQ